MKSNKVFSIIIVLLLMYTGCDLIDGTGVENPNLTLDEAAIQPNSAQAIVTGLNRRMAYVYGGTQPNTTFLTVAELTTDNYVNRATFYNQNVDNGQFRDTDPDMNGPQFQMHVLREIAMFGLTTVLENDPEAAGTELEAEMYFHKGWAHLLIAETFVALPAEPQEVPLLPGDHFQLAVEAFTAANQIQQKVSYNLALARAHYGTGNAELAVSYAEMVLATEPDFVRFVRFDGLNAPASSFEDAVYNRQTFNDLQPLPRLDFLDPKYGGEPGTVVTPVPIQKAEEAYLTIAEAQLAQGPAGVAPAQQTLLDLLALVQSRPVDLIDDSEEGRVGTAVTLQRPNRSDYLVAAESGAPLRAGLVLDRTSSTPTPRISGTSVTEDMIMNAVSPEEALYILYLMRQEIFFGEGRRMFDLGIRWPISENEALNNEYITDEQRLPFIPSYIPSNYGDMNRIDDKGIDEEGNRIEVENYEAVILVDMNRVLVANRGNQFN